MNKYLIFGFFLFFQNIAFAQEPTIVFGKAATPDGQSDAFILEQPENSPNPLGNPIVAPDNQNSPAVASTNTPSSKENTTETQNNNSPVNVINQSLPADPQPSAEYTLQKEDSMIQNTIYRGSDRLYDIQSIPLNELDKINVQGLEPNLTTYPVR